ncbi:MAG: SapC family protein [Desulfobulbaceae bacterium]|nr:SapC family protein [Desulfobulbaceae bacterium]
MAQEGVYKNPILLNQVAHKHVKVSKPTGYKFAKGQNSVLLAGQEFMQAAKYYPIAFVRDKNLNEIMPLAILGLRTEENLFVDNEGKWKEGVYIPAFFRRYPFVLADDQGEAGAYSISVDAAFEGFDSDDGMPLFDEEGKPTQELNHVIEFLKQYQTNFMLTQELLNKLDEFGLFQEFTADITLPAGEKIALKGLMRIDEKALMNLDDEKALELYRKGFLAWIYAHLFSLSNFRQMGQFIVEAGDKEKEEAVVED